MKRRHFLSQLGYGVPVSLAFSSILQSCSKDNNGVSPNNKYKGYEVIVVGAGAAGLQAAWSLKQQGFGVTILEASGRLGGRIKSHSGFADYDIEMGAERIYGSNTEWHSLVNASGKKINSAQPEDFYFFRQNPSDPSEPALKNRNEASTYSDFAQMMNFINQAPNYSGPDVNVESAFTSQAPWSMVGVANGMIGNHKGTVNHRLGMRGYAHEMAAQTIDEQVLTLEQDSLFDVLNDQFSSVLEDIRYNQPVKTITYADDQVTVSTQSGQTFTADRVVVTVPITVLKKGNLTFSPALPATKKEALEKMDMTTGLKVQLQFSTPFWEEKVSKNLGSIYGHNFLPEIYASNLGRSETPVLTAYVMGERAEQFSSMDSNVAISLMLSYLDETFSSQAPSQSFVHEGYHFTDWSKEPFINGAYSYLKVGGSIIHREELAKPIDGKLFFAGEATHFKGHSGSVHGAIETGLRAAIEVEESIV